MLSTLAKNKISLPSIKIPKQESAVNLNINFLNSFSFGNKRFLSAILWINTLVESDIEHYNQQNLGSWMYLRFNSILQLDPKFLEAYRFGALYLSVIKDDIVGASDIFTRGLTKYPNDWELNFYGGHHYFFEVNDKKTAFKLFNNIRHHSRTGPIIISILAKMKAQEGNLEIAHDIIRDAYNKNRDGGPFEKKFYQSLYSIRAEIDLNCLNSKFKKDNCRLLDIDGRPYVKTQVGYKAQKIWQPVRFKNRKNISL